MYIVNTKTIGRFLSDYLLSVLQILSG